MTGQVVGTLRSAMPSGGSAGDDANALAVARATIPLAGDGGRAGVARTPVADAEGRVRLRDPGLGVGAEGDPSFTVTGGDPPRVFDEGAAEAESCAFDPPPDGRRYAACGDGVAAPQAHWIALRLLAVMRGDDPDAPALRSSAGGGSRAFVLGAEAWRAAAEVVCPECGSVRPVEREDAEDERVGGYYCEGSAREAHPAAMMVARGGE